MPQFFQESIAGDWVYPCDLPELEARLATIPEEHLHGLWAVGLACSTEKHHTRNGVYSAGNNPVIRLYSHRSDLCYKQPAWSKDKDMHGALLVERAYGMRIEKDGTRFWCYWSMDTWKEFILDYVLRHEIGHHIFWMRHKHRSPNWDTYHRNQSEQFAEKYAREHSKFWQLEPL